MMIYKRMREREREAMFAQDCVSFKVIYTSCKGQVRSGNGSTCASLAKLPRSVRLMEDGEALKRPSPLLSSGCDFRLLH